MIMRKLFSLLLVVAALAGAGGARADIGPPVNVRILGEPRAAQPGVPFKGQLQIETGAPLVLDDMMFMEDGWNQLLLDVGPQMTLDKARPQVVDFEVVTNDPGQPLVLSFTVEGTEFTRTFDLSPEAVAFVLGPNPVMKVPSTGDVPPLTEETRVSPPVDGTQPSPHVGEKGRNIRVRGRFVYVRSDGNTIGADGMTVRVYDNDSPFGSAELAVVATDAQGWYDVTFWWGDDFFDPQPDVYVRFETTNTRVRTESPAWLSGPYSWDTGTINDYGGSDLDFGWLQPSDINQHPAVHIQTNLTRTWRWWTGYGYDTPYVAANWPNGATGAFYNGEIYFSTGEQWNENVASHEYGHHWVQLFALSPAPAYCNGVCDTDGCGHCLWCAETANVSFTEGFPDWMGDVIPRSFLASYGRAALASYDMESVLLCGNAAYRDPYMTEGNLAAVVRDIGDGTNDNEAAYPETDELSLGWGPAITTVDLDHPTTAAAFLTAFKNRYPAWREGLWATARNDNYDIDVSAPPAVTGLYSSSHSVSVGSPDPTIDMAWTRAYDDASGVRGYGIEIAGGIGLPSAVMDIGDVTSYSTSSLPPGTYYFAIRTLDRSGKWSATYAWNGPYIVRSALPANLAFYQFAGWNSVLVPRPAADASFGSVPAPATLPGNDAGTWWNVGLWNSGESATEGGFQARAYVDGDWQYWVSWGVIGSHGGAFANNLGPIWARGGRHTFEARLDALDEVAETNEGDNRWAHQWVWSPLPLVANTWTTRGAPPLKSAGWDAVSDGSSLYVNNDGLRMNATAWWDVAVMRPLAADADYDVYLHAASTGAADGFASTLAASGRLSGLLDAVVVNHNVVAWDNCDVGVVNYNGNSANYEIVHQTNSFMAFGDSTTVPFAQDQMLRIWEVYVAPGQVGPVSVTVDVDPAGGPLVAQWLDKTFQRGGLSSYYASSVTDASGRARLDMSLADSGYHALVVYRDPTWSKTTGPIDVTIEIDTTPPDFMPKYAAGWHAPFVPRAAADGAWNSVPVPATLPGNVASTYLNLSVRNESPSASPGGLPGEMYLDGSYTWWVAWGAFPAYTDGLFNWNAAWTVRGGRHTLALQLDAHQAIEEIHENNNIYGEQYVWSPLDLVNDNPVYRYGPPDPYGDWTNVNSGETFYPNCDGVRMPNAGGYWRAVAVMPDADTDVDLRLHLPSAGAKDGFANNLAGSYWWAGNSDYVLVNFNLAGFQPYDAGVVNFAGTGGYVTESTATSSWISNPAGIYGPYSLPADRILNLIEVYLPAGPMGIHLMDLGGGVDYGLSLHRGDTAYLGKSDAIAMAADGFGSGQDELLVVDVPAAGWYCVSAWKKGSADLAQAGTYNLRFYSGWTSGVGDDVPAPSKTALVDITPNPFNPQTKITYELAGESQVQLAIFDLQGHLVRTLVNGSRATGRHIETWDGSDENGGKVASGMYVAKLTAGGVTQMMKMTLLK
jgi:hypothetical protein